MTAVIVPPSRGLMTYTDILTGRAVRAITWQDWAQLTTWLAGRGAQLAAAHSPAVLLAEGATYQTHLLTRGNYAGIQRLWCFWIRGDGAVANVDISINGGATSTHEVPAARQSVSPILVVHDVSSQQDAAEDLRYDIAPDGGDVWVDAVAVVEVPRVQIENDANELGVTSAPFRSGQPHRNVDWSNGAELLTGTEHGRRHLFAWGVPHIVDAAADNDYAWATSSGSLVDVFDLHPPIAARMGVPGETERGVLTRITAKLGAGATKAEIYIGTTSRAPTIAHTITSSTFATYSYTQTVDVEDPDEASGLQGGTWDGLRIQARITGGAGPVYIYGGSAYED